LAAGVLIPARRRISSAGIDKVMDMLRGVQDLKEAKQSTVPDFFAIDFLYRHFA
jgi:hypothetical protein